MEEQKEKTAKFLREIPEFIRWFIKKDILEQYGYNSDLNKAETDGLFEDLTASSPDGDLEGKRGTLLMSLFFKL